ncbi:MAG: dockerin type I repeat-containing protein, partial [Bacteroidales bacterium]|nr:dockerin type I repeat-containing protein [Candidatus Sodaliphilus aphodohippi]
TYYNPMVYMRPYLEMTVKNASTDASSYEWSYQKWNGEDYEDLTANTTDLVESWSWGEGFYAPLLKANGTSSYRLFSNYFDDDNKEIVKYDGFYLFNPDPYEYMEGNAFVSPKVFSAGVRDNSGYPGMYIYTGAQGVKDDPSDGSGHWFGKNYAGWNGMGIYVEKPTYAYALRGLAVKYAAFQMAPGATDPVELTATIYKAKKDSEGELEIGEPIMTAVAQLTADDAASNTLYFPLVEDEDGIETEVVLEIDEPLFITVTGYDNDNIKTWSMHISNDREDEGFGEIGYMLANVQDNDATTAERCIGLSEFFKNSVGFAAPTIFMDVEYPIVILNYSADTPEYKFPTNGGEIAKKFEDGKTYKGVHIFSSKSADELSITEKGKEDLPEWLDIEVNDVMKDGEYTGEVVADVQCQPLPNGVAYRECVVDFGVPGGHLYYTMTQGTKPAYKTGDVNNDGSVDIKDLNIVINIVLGQDDAANYQGRADVNADGRVDIVDVNAIINLILG